MSGLDRHTAKAYAIANRGFAESEANVDAEINKIENAGLTKEDLYLKDRQAAMADRMTVKTAHLNGDSTDTSKDIIKTTINTEATQVLSIDDRLRYAYAADFVSPHTEKLNRSTYRANIYAGAKDFMALVDEAADKAMSSVTDVEKAHAAGRFVPKLQVATREPRPTWAQLQKALQNRIIPNELYEDDDGEYELTTYNITLFMVEEGRLFNTRLNDLSQSIKNIGDVEKMGGIVVAQSASSDDFYIENLTYKTGVGGFAPLMTAIEFTIKSPYQADFVDYIFKAAEKLKVRNYMDFPLHMLIEFKGRNAKTSKAKLFDTSRCYAMLISNMDLTVDESGGTYAVRAFRASERGLGQDKVYLKKDITISGKTVGGVLGELVGRLQNATAKEERNVWVPDVYKIEIPTEWKDWPVKTSYEATFSNQTSNINGAVDQAQSVPDVNGSQVAGVGHTNSGNSVAIDRSQSQKYLNESSMIRTFVFKTGTDILSVIQQVLNTAAEFQMLVVGGEYNPQDADATGARATPENIWKFYAKMDVDVEYIGYDKNTRQYACKRIYQVIKHHDPLLGANEESTQQTKETSTSRLHSMLAEGAIAKAYFYYYTGLNTEIKSLDLNFDNHYIMARSLASKKGGMAKRISGVNADDKTDIAVGATSPVYSDLHDKYKQQIGAVEGDIMALDATFASQVGYLTAGSTQNIAALEGKLQATKARRNVKQKELDILLQYENITSAQHAAAERGELQINFEGTATTDRDTLLMDAGRKYYSETVQKIMPPVLTYIGDLQKKSDDGVLFPVKLSNTRAPERKTGTTDDAHQGGNILSEIIAQRMGANMINLNLELRGDPYWLPENLSGNNKNSISPAHRQPMLIIIASQVSDHNAAGLFQVNERNSISAVYNVINVVHTFSGGEFLQTLACARDTQIDINAVLRAPDKFIKYNEHVELTGGDFSDGAGWE